MSTITDDLRSRCDQLSDAAADEIDALEQAYASLYKSFGQQRTELDTAEARLAEQGDTISQLRIDLAEAEAVIAELHKLTGTESAAVAADSADVERRPCTCPDGERPIPCPRKFAVNECQRAAGWIEPLQGEPSGIQET